MKKNIIYNKSAHNMSEIKDESVDVMITSPPYNINISYGEQNQRNNIWTRFR